MLFALLGLHAVLAAVAPAAARRLGGRVFWLCALAPAATVALAVARAGGILSGEALRAELTWVGELGLSAALTLDAFSLVMVTLVSGVGVLVFIYSRPYFSHGGDLGKFASRLTAFAGAMLGLVLADNLLILYVFWELTSIVSYLLIGFDDERGSARAAALQALLVTVAGGLTMLAGFVLLGQAAGTYSLSAIVADPPRGPVAAAGALLTLAGAFTKSAQVPFHAWLPAAMAAPTPVSAYLHSATMVKAGVYLVARLAPAFAAAVTGWRTLVVAVGVVTMLVGGYRALRQHDLKQLLAFGTVSQLGLMTALFGAGLPETTAAGVVLLLAHGMFKAVLFLVAGIVEHQAGTRDLRRLSGLGHRLPATAAVAGIAAASMAGLPPLFGFVSKEATYDSFLNAGLGDFGTLALAGIVAGSILTFAYSWRFVWGAFATKRSVATRRAPAGAGAPSDTASPTPEFLAPAAALACLTVAFGIDAGPLTRLVSRAAAALVRGVELDRLALWHGLSTALMLSVLTIAAGVLMAAGRVPIERWQGRLKRIPSTQEGYRRSITGLNRIADQITGIVQNGSLPTYLGVILLTMVALPAWSLRSAGLPTPQRVAENPLQLLVAAGIVVAAFGTIYSSKRFTAVLFLGGVGYGVAVLFIIQGAPDLALTQFLIETLSLVIFVLVLRHLPAEFGRHRWALGQNLRRVVAAAVGLFVFGFALIAGSVNRPGVPVSLAFLDRALPEAGGRNIVNVILVDFRGFDTLGEITVLCVAALGIASLLRASRPSSRDHAGKPAATAVETEEAVESEQPSQDQAQETAT